MMRDTLGEILSLAGSIGGAQNAAQTQANAAQQNAQLEAELGQEQLGYEGRDTLGEILSLAEEIAGAEAGAAMGAQGGGYEFADLDSLEYVELIQRVEERFKVSIPWRAMAGVTRADALARLVEMKMEERGELRPGAGRQ